MIPVGSVGLAVSQSMALTMLLQMAAKFTADFLGQMTAVERVLEYTKLPIEDDIDNGRKYTNSVFFLCVDVPRYFTTFLCFPK